MSNKIIFEDDNIKVVTSVIYKVPSKWYTIEELRDLKLNKHDDINGQGHYQLKDDFCVADVSCKFLKNDIIYITEINKLDMRLPILEKDILNENSWKVQLKFPSLPITNVSGDIEGYESDILYGYINLSERSLSLMSLYGIIDRVRFSGTFI